MNAAARSLTWTENAALMGALAISTVLPLIDLVGGAVAGFRLSSTHLFVQHATLWLAFVGAVAATRQGAHLTLSTTEFLREGRARALSQIFGCSIAAAVSAALAYASFAFVLANRNDRVLPAIGVPEWVSALVMPVALAVMALLFAWKASDRWPGRLFGLLVIPATFALGLVPRESAGMLWPLGLVVMGGALFGAPVFVAMGGIAMVGFLCQGSTVASVSSQVYRLLASETLPAIPLLTAAGYVLAESAAAERLVRFFRALFGWMPGGVPVVVAAVCAMFTTFTGGSGITIVALGGLVYPVLGATATPRGSPWGSSPPPVRSACSSRPASPSSSTALSRPRVSRAFRYTASTLPGSCRACCSSSSPPATAWWSAARRAGSGCRSARPTPPARPGRRSGNCCCR